MPPGLAGTYRRHFCRIAALIEGMSDLGANRREYVADCLAERGFDALTQGIEHNGSGPR